jgi:heme-degrading monooxygenase HmoA
VISRHWFGLARPQRAEDYIQHLVRETLPQLRQIAGFVDASLLSRRTTEGVEFLVVTRWVSLDAIRRFAGSDAEAAVVPSAVADMMVRYDLRAHHFEVIEFGSDV